MKSYTMTLRFMLALSTYAVLMPIPSLAQAPPDPNYVRQQIYPSYTDFKNDLLTTVNIVDPVQREAALDALWTTLQNAGQVPYAQDNQVALLYRGTANSVSWPGDFNGWNEKSDGKLSITQGRWWE